MKISDYLKSMTPDQAADVLSNFHSNAASDENRVISAIMILDECDVDTAKFTMNLQLSLTDQRKADQEMLAKLSKHQTS